MKYMESNVMKYKESNVMKYNKLNRMLWEMALGFGCVMAFLLVQGWGIKACAQGMDGNLVDRLKMHVGFLAHDSLEGRQSGSPAERKAAAYLIKHFAMHGLQAAGDSGRWTQSFPILVRQAAAPDAVLKVGKKVLEQGKHFVVLPGSGSGEVVGHSVDAGYGIESDSLNYHDLKDSLLMK
ncbi:MAG: hypothetical protein ACKO7V_05555, partial [Bacteroidota bacterium]